MRTTLARHASTKNAARSDLSGHQGKRASDDVVHFGSSRGNKHVIARMGSHIWRPSWTFYRDDSSFPSLDRDQSIQGEGGGRVRWSSMGTIHLRIETEAENDRSSVAYNPPRHEIVRPVSGGGERTDGFDGYTPFDVVIGDDWPRTSGTQTLITGAGRSHLPSPAPNERRRTRFFERAALHALWILSFSRARARLDSTRRVASLIATQHEVASSRIFLVVVGATPLFRFRAN